MRCRGEALQGLAASTGLLLIGSDNAVELPVLGFRHASGGIRGEQLGRSTGDLAFS
jgi:hypothetical protein